MTRLEGVSMSQQQVPGVEGVWKLEVGTNYLMNLVLLPLKCFMYSKALHCLPHFKRG